MKTLGWLFAGFCLGIAATRYAGPTVDAYIDRISAAAEAYQAAE